MENHENGIGQRIKELIFRLNLNQSTFAESVGVSQTAIYNTINAKTKPKYELILSILKNHPTVNEAWLREGKGEMFINEVSKNIETPETQNNDGDALGNYINTLLENQINELKQALQNAYYTIELQKKMLERNFLDPNTGQPKMDLILGDIYLGNYA